jgi:hypothetical protein
VAGTRIIDIVNAVLVVVTDFMLMVSLTFFKVITQLTFFLKLLLDLSNETQ